MRCEVRRSGTRAADGLPRDRLDAGTMHDTEGDHGQQLAAARGLASSPTDSQAACMAGEADVDTVWVHCVGCDHHTAVAPAQATGWQGLLELERQEPAKWRKALQ